MDWRFISNSFLKLHHIRQICVFGTKVLQSWLASLKSIGNNTPRRRFLAFRRRYKNKNNKFKGLPVKAYDVKAFSKNAAPAFSIRCQSIFVRFVLLMFVGLLSLNSQAEKAGLDAEIEELKTEVVELNRALFDLEEQLLYPATTSFAVFVSMDDIDGFQLSSVKLNLDQQDVTSHLYSREQVEALKRGGIQKIFMSNLKPGMHKISAEIMGKDRDGRAVKRVVVADFGKARSSKYLEVKISKSTKQSNNPDFAIVEWK